MSSDEVGNAAALLAEYEQTSVRASRRGVPGGAEMKYQETGGDQRRTIDA